MPIYEYACESCGHRFEKLVSMSADAPPCPDCEASDVRKLISQSGFILKGGGWYKDHYGLKSGGGSASAESTSSAGTASSTDTGASSSSSDSSSSSTSSDSGSSSSGGSTSGSSTSTAAAK